MHVNIWKIKLPDSGKTELETEIMLGVCSTNLSKLQNDSGKVFKMKVVPLWVQYMPMNFQLNWSSMISYMDCLVQIRQFWTVYFVAIISCGFWTILEM